MGRSLARHGRERHGYANPHVSYRKYLIKLNAKLRIQVLSKEWKIDGPNTAPRMPETYKEVAITVGLALEDKADIGATKTRYLP